MISGLPEIDIDDLRANTEYSGYTAASRQIQWCVLLQACCVTPMVTISGRKASGTPQLLWPDFQTWLMHPEAVSPWHIQVEPCLLHFGLRPCWLQPPEAQVHVTLLSATADWVPSLTELPFAMQVLGTCA